MVLEIYKFVIIIGILSFLGTIGLAIVFRILGQNHLIGNLYTNVRGGIPRGIGLVPCILLCMFLPKGLNALILTIGFFAFLDDILGRYKPKFLPIELGQLSRGIGMIVVMIMGYELLGFSSILIALMIQPINISDMQPGSTCSVVIIMSLLALLIGLPSNNLLHIYQVLIVLVCCIAYSPLDYAGRIMMGEVGNHSFAIALGIVFYSIGGGFVNMLLFFIITTILIAFIRRNTMKTFFRKQLKINNPVFGDFFMDVLTGGGLGDSLRKIFLGKKQIHVKNPILMILGFRRLLYNPHAVKKQQNYSLYLIF
ncbi:MAG: cell wall biosynthesis protein [Methanobrevibacter sp.]|jgi:hypothetical protein|nr:cell wall biosynthesis protein [Candidatus Methanovirga basalitermitum]